MTEAKEYAKMDDQAWRCIDAVLAEIERSWGMKLDPGAPSHRMMKRRMHVHVINVLSGLMDASED